MIKRITAIAIAALMLSGCMYDKHDAYGNLMEPHASAITFDPVRTMQSADVFPWCLRNRGVLTRDNLACVWVHDSTREFQCVQIIHPSLGGDELAADRRFMNSVCNGWHPFEIY